MTEILTGKEGVRAAYADGKPEEWEASLTMSPQDWRPYETWRKWCNVDHEKRQFRRIQKPREPSSLTVEAVVRVPDFSWNRPHIVVALDGWEPRTVVRVTITELIDGAEPEPDWRARCEQAEKELGELRNSFEKRAEALLAELQRVKTRHGENLGRLTETIETMQGELEND